MGGLNLDDVQVNSRKTSKIFVEEIIKNFSVRGYNNEKILNKVLIKLY